MPRVGLYRPALVGVNPEICDLSMLLVSQELSRHVGLECEFYVVYQAIMVQALGGLPSSLPEICLDFGLNVVRLFACSDQVMVV